MRIAIVSDFYLDFVGGQQSSIHEQQAALTSAGHEVFLVVCARGARGVPVRMHGNTLEVRPAFTLPQVTLPVVGARPRLVEVVRAYFAAHAVDVVHLQTEFGLAHAATTAAHKLGLPVVHTVHTFYWRSTGWATTILTPALRRGLENVTGVRIPRSPLVKRPSDNLLKNLTIAMASRADAVVSPSAHQAADLEAAGVSPPVAVVPNPIARSQHPAALLTEEQVVRPRLLWVSRCEAEKRPLAFAEAAIEALARTGGAFEVDFVGDGRELQALRKLAEGHPQLRVHGGLPHDAVIELMDAAALVALVSVGFDNQPMTIAEAVSRYRGVLYCDPKLREGLGAAGHLTATPDVRGMSDSIVALVQDPARLLALSAGAQRDAVTFSGDAYVERILAVYEEARAHLASP